MPRIVYGVYVATFDLTAILETVGEDNLMPIRKLRSLFVRCLALETDNFTNY